ncbi:MAG: glycolate oxidase subunit GlcE [Pseudomonadota bacterium]
MADTWKAESEAQVVEAVAWAAAESQPLEVVGRASKRGLGRPVQAAHGLDLSGLSGITLYEPEELVLSARAGTPLAEIAQALEEKGQQLAFEPPDLGPLLGQPAGAGSAGGLVACNLAGPRRLKAGAARDHFLGLEAVSGRGESFKSGGRVVKNVTGYDLCKLLAGSYGTLAAMTQITLKVLPKAEKTRTVLLYGLDDRQAVAAMTRAVTSSHEVSGAAHLPAGVASELEIAYVGAVGGAVTALRVEGPAPSAEYRAAALRRELGDLAETEELHGHNSGRLWQAVGNVEPFVGWDEAVVWRLSVAPSQAPDVLARLGALKGLSHYCDWGGGLIWLALPSADDGHHQAVRAALGADGGHATLIRAPETVRAAVPVFQPQAPALAALSQRVKEAFDPHGVLNPGRMAAGPA